MKNLSWLISVIAQNPTVHGNDTRACNIYRSRNRSVSVVTRLQAGRPGFNFRKGQRFFSSLPHPDLLWGPPSLPSNGYRGFFPLGKAAGREADHSPPSSAEVKNAWSYTSDRPRLHDAVHN
jgi:hypothetical protein